MIEKGEKEKVSERGRRGGGVCTCTCMKQTGRKDM